MQAAVAASLEYLRSDAARASIAKDPYWPKWDSPWWHVQALFEAGLEVPADAVRALVEAAQRHYLPYFAKTAAELPPGKTLRHHVLCFCSMASLLRAAGEVATLSWADAFFRENQKPDGGWNCDEASAVGSVVSTVPVLEYLLGRPGFEAAVDRGVQYLLQRRLCRSKTSGAVLDPAWLTPSFPRFYEYDVLRGLSLLARWGGDVPREAVAEALAVDPSARRCWPLNRSAWPGNGVESTFPLLEALGQPAAAGPILAAGWARVRAHFG